ADAQDVHGSEPGVLIDWPVDHDAPRRLAFVADMAAPCASLVDLHAREQASAQREELNALYVAMTRARETLLFSRTAPRRGSGISWWSRVLPHSAAFEAATPLPRSATVNERIVIGELPGVASTRGVAPAPTPIAQPSHAARLGRALHRVLQWAGAAAGEVDFAGLASAAGVEFGLPPTAAAAAADCARTIRASPALQRFFDPRQFAWSADEFDIVHDGTPLRLDRLVRFGAARSAHWWVLDYKLALDAADDPLLREQLERYRAAVRLLADGAPVHAAIVTGDGALHELPAVHASGRE
ncbi:MAG TPA: DNA helicase UvrD, partial [Burkholderiaceae bacterium]